MEATNVSKIKDAILRNNDLFDALADLYKVFGDGTRVRILCALTQSEMNVGEIKGPVQTQFGYHLIRLDKKNEAKEIPFEEIKPQLAQKVLSDKQQVAYASKLNQLKILFPVDMY